MTDRLKGCTVVFEKDIREDDAEALLNAIGCMRNVATVQPVIANSMDAISEDRERLRLWDGVRKVFFPKP